MSDAVDAQLGSRSARSPASPRSSSAASRSRRSASRSIQARRQGPVAGGRAQPDRDHDGRQPKASSTAPQRLHHLRQRPVAGFQGLERRHHCLPQRRPLRIRDIGQAVSGPEDAKQAAWANGKRGVFLVMFKQPGANVIETVDKIKRRCRGWSRRSATRSRSR